MRIMRFWFIALVFTVLCGQPAVADTLFSDLASGYISGLNVYPISGSASLIGQNISEAALFPVAGTGTEAVTQIDLAVYGVGAFSASIYTDAAGVPGAQVQNAFWNLNPAATGSCCSAVSTPLASVTGISGVSLTGGTSYFLVLTPGSTTTSDFFAVNAAGFAGQQLDSVNGGAWVASHNNEGAFAVLGSPIQATTPEPSSVVLLGTGLLATVFITGKRSRQVYS